MNVLTKIYLLISIFVVLILTTGLNSSDWKSELKQIRQEYVKASSVDLEMIVTLKDIKNKSYENFTSIYKRQAKNSFYKGIDYELIVNAGIGILVSKDDKVIMVYPQVNTDMQLKHEKWLLVLDSSEHFTLNDIEYKKLEGGKRFVSFSYLNTEIKKVEFQYSATDKKMEVVRLFLIEEIEGKDGKKLESPYIEIKYKKQQLNQTIPSQFFSYSSYVTKIDDTYELTPKFKNYELYIHPSHTKITH